MSDDDGNQRRNLSQTAKALADDLVRCADLIDNSANPEFFRIISFQLQRAGLHIGNAVRAAERGFSWLAVVDAVAERDGVTV